jgi:hypothetical protein
MRLAGANRLDFNLSCRLFFYILVKELGISVSDVHNDLVHTVELAQFGLLAVILRSVLYHIHLAAVLKTVVCIDNGMREFSWLSLIPKPPHHLFRSGQFMNRLAIMFLLFLFNCSQVVRSSDSIFIAFKFLKHILRTRCHRYLGVLDTLAAVIRKNVIESSPVQKVVPAAVQQPLDLHLGTEVVITFVVEPIMIAVIFPVVDYDILNGLTPVSVMLVCLKMLNSIRESQQVSLCHIFKSPHNILVSKHKPKSKPSCHAYGLFIYFCFFS